MSRRKNFRKHHLSRRKHQLRRRKYQLRRRKHQLNWRRWWKTRRDGVIRIKRFDVGWHIFKKESYYNLWYIHEFVVSSVTCNPYKLIMMYYI